MSTATNVLYPNCIIMITQLHNIPLVLWQCWLGSRKSIWLVKKWVMRCWHGHLSEARCERFAYGPADVTATQSSHALLKSRLLPAKNPDWFNLCGGGLPRLSWKRGWLLNGCLSHEICYRSFFFHCLLFSTVFQLSPLVTSFLVLDGTMEEPFLKQPIATTVNVGRTGCSAILKQCSSNVHATTRDAKQL